MNFRQIRALNGLVELNIAQQLAEIREEINAINAIINAIKPKRGPSPGMAELKNRVEIIENAIRRQDKGDMSE
jgi:hypothetical protein